MWVSRSLKAPDQGEWIALVSVNADGETAIIGYIEQREFESILIGVRRLSDWWQPYLDRESEEPSV